MNNKYRAYVKHNGKRIHGGYFTTKEEAALKYNELAIATFKEFAVLNEVEV